MSQGRNVQNTHRPRNREKNTTKVKPTLQTLTANITAGPDRTALYYESEHCYDDASSGDFSTPFLVTNSPYLDGYVYTCVSSVEHEASATHRLKLRGIAEVQLKGAKTSGVHAFTAIYDAQSHTGTFTIQVPSNELPKNIQTS